MPCNKRAYVQRCKGIWSIAEEAANGYWQRRSVKGVTVENPTIDMFKEANHTQARDKRRGVCYGMRYA
jgi:hypothetical protein